MTYNRVVSGGKNCFIQMMFTDIDGNLPKFALGQIFDSNFIYQEFHNKSRRFQAYGISRKK